MNALKGGGGKILKTVYGSFKTQCYCVSTQSEVLMSIMFLNRSHGEDYWTTFSLAHTPTVLVIITLGGIPS